MRIVYQRCCGLDVHKESVTACLLLIDDEGEYRVEKRRFSTMTRDLRDLAAWLRTEGIERIAMEATGVYWRPVWNILEPLGFELLLVNAQHIKNVPGRKTDQKDSEWIADLLQHGLLRGSFVPPSEIRQLRDLTRMRARMRQELATYANRIQKVLEDANIKLGAVASNVLGVSGRHMLKALMSGERDPKQLAAMARGRLREKCDALELALDGHFTDHHRFQLTLLFDLLEYGEMQMAKLEVEIHRLLNQVGNQEPSGSLQTAVDLWKTIPGIDDLTASMLVAEIGPNMDQFPDAHHLASWAGLCPGNNESAGKRRSGKTRKGSVWLRRGLCQAAWASSRAKNTYLAALYRRMIARRGKKKTIVAVAHAMLIIAYHLLKRACVYQDLGADYFEQLDRRGLQRRLVNRLGRLDFQVTLTPAPKPS
jgi:transposase